VPPMPPMLSSATGGEKRTAVSMAARNTVRSAPDSTRQGALIHAPSRPCTSAGITGRSTPSSHACHTPLISRHPGHPFTRDQTRKAAVVMRAGSCGHGKRFFWRVGDKERFTRDTKALPSVHRVPLRGVRLKSGPVPRKTRLLCLCLLPYDRIAHLFHHDGSLLNSTFAVP
jgi:hypothetical protein